jgi:hypothetical protein
MKKRKKRKPKPAAVAGKQHWACPVSMDTPLLIV